MNCVIEKGFDKQRFLSYLSNVYSDFSHQAFRFLVENLVDYGFKHECVSKDQFCYWLSDLLPDISFGEVAAFMDDECLTKYGKEEKDNAILEYNIKD